tara:strand:+ start:1467 stop:2042 length:576 start_codon:yes stop_codon:yes gene_type:complete
MEEKTDEEILREIKHDEMYGEDFEDKHPFFKKTIVVVISVFLILMLLVYVFTVSPVRDIIFGLIDSELIVDGVAEFDGNKLSFMNNSLEILQEVNRNNPDLEFKACLKGYVEEGDYFIEEVYIPEMYLQKHNQVISEPCSDDSIVSLHSHPLNRCLPSETDVSNYKYLRNRNPDAIMAVMCREDRINFFKT